MCPSGIGRANEQRSVAKSYRTTQQREKGMEEMNEKTSRGGGKLVAYASSSNLKSTTTNLNSNFDNQAPVSAPPTWRVPQIQKTGWRRQQQQGDKRSCCADAQVGLHFALAHTKTHSLSHSARPIVARRWLPGLPLTVFWSPQSFVELLQDSDCVQSSAVQFADAADRYKASERTRRKHNTM